MLTGESLRATYFGRGTQQNRKWENGVMIGDGEFE